MPMLSPLKREKKFYNHFDFLVKTSHPAIITPVSSNIGTGHLYNLLDNLRKRAYRPIVYLHTDIIPVEGTQCDLLSCPKDVVEMANQYPDFYFVMAHCGRWCHATERDIADVKNVYIDTSIAPLFLIIKSLGVVGKDRVVFGSDYPYSHPKIELQKIQLLPVPESVREAILFRNFQKLVSYVSDSSDVAVGFS